MLQLVAYQKKSIKGAVYFKQHEVRKKLNNLRPKPYNLNIENSKRDQRPFTPKNFPLKRFLMQHGHLSYS